MSEEGWVENHGVRLHYIDSSPGGRQGPPPVVYIPGMLGRAEDFSKEMQTLAPRRCIALSLRGRGKSESPRSGYSFEHHISDIEALVDKLHLRGFFMMAHSVGVAYAIGYAVRHPRLLRGLIVGDFPAVYHSFSEKWADWVIKTHPGLAQPHALRSMQSESTEVRLWEDLDKLNVPLLVLRGGKDDSLLPADAAEMYMKHSRNAKVVVLEDSGHELVKPNYRKYIGVIREFLEGSSPNRQAGKSGRARSGKSGIQDK